MVHEEKKGKLFGSGAFEIFVGRTVFMMGIGGGLFMNYADPGFWHEMVTNSFFE